MMSAKLSGILEQQWLSVWTNGKHSVRHREQLNRDSVSRGFSSKHTAVQSINTYWMPNTGLGTEDVIKNETHAVPPFIEIPIERLRITNLKVVR